MVLLPQPSKEDIINDLIEKGYEESYPREYIGYSELGGPCKRAIWYSFRWTKLRRTIPRMKRLFSRGDWEEDRIINDLKSIGVEVFGEQKLVSGIANHVFGHIDGLGEKVPGFPEGEILLLEFKTANQKNFDSTKKKGVQIAKSTYYYQAQSYMGKLKLNNCLFIMTNKNDEKRYIEIIPFDDLAFTKIEHIAFEILSTDIPPDRIGNSTWYECKYCNFRDICHFNGPVLKSCRSCQQGTIEEGGAWVCGLTDKRLTAQQQKDACDKYKILENIKD